MSWPLPSTRDFHELLKEVRKIAQDVHAIRTILARPHLTRLELSIMPKTIEVGQTAVAHLTGVGSDGNPFAFTAANNITMSGDANASFGPPTFNADGSADVVVTALAVDPADDISATVDGVGSNRDTLTIVAAAPTLSTVTLTLQ
jgi:hypothetical protein